MSEQLVPQIRFDGFDGEWEKTVFGALAKRKSYIERGTSLPRLEYEDINSGLGTLNKDIRRKGSKKPGVLFAEGDVLFGKLRPYLKNWFLPNYPGVAVGDFWVLTPQHAAAKFVYALIQTKQFTVVSNISSGSKMPRSDWKLVSETTFSLPGIVEQQDIGTLFADLDASIDQHRRRHQQLKQTKASLMERMFPAPGETVPQIRFDGFDGEWALTCLANLIERGGAGGTPSTANPAYYGGRIPFIGIADISAREISSTKKSLTGQGLTNSAAWVVPAGAVALAMYASVGRVGILAMDAATSQAFYNMVFETTATRDFVFARLVKAELDLEWERLISTGTQRNLNADKVRSFELLVPPTLAEQRAIGEFFAKLDALIEAQQHRVEQLQQVKASLLQKMFV